MASDSKQMDQIKAALLHPPTTQTLEARSTAYESLLQLQQRHAASVDAISSQFLLLLPVIVDDVALQDEEIAAQALKCLGFVVYHPSIVSRIPEDTAHLVLESLAKLVITTRMKAICNLSVWCFSIQQFDASILDFNLHSLLRAIVHALDNPFGSLSTTYEATQAVVKLATQLCGKMREMACIWAPPIYRRLVSNDKKERDILERCLLKIESSMFPPPLSLSKAFASDLKPKLLTRLMDMLQDHGLILSAIQAWKWYIRLLGPLTLKRRHMTNGMLKVPGMTFSNPDHQIQMATLVAWESFIDALVPDQILELDVNKSEVNGMSTGYDALKSCFQTLEVDLLRSIKLIMNPLLKILSSNFEASVLSSCLNTWYYFMHKLDFLINHHSVIAIVLEPVLEAVFSKGPDDKCIWLWDSCVNLLDEFVLSKVHDRKNYMHNGLKSLYQSTKNTCSLSYADSKRTWKTHCIKWPCWNLGDVNYFLKVLRKLTTQKMLVDVSLEKRILSFSSALRIFKSILKGIQLEIKKVSSDYSSNQVCISTILSFLNELLEDVKSMPAVVHRTLLCISLQFVSVMRDELEPGTLASPLYNVDLDLNYIKKLQSAKDTEYRKFLGISSLECTKMVSPMVYLNVLYFCVVAQLISEFPEENNILSAMRILIFTFSPCDMVLSFRAIITLLFMHGRKREQGRLFLLKMWRTIAESLEDNMHTVNDVILSKVDFDDTSCGLMHLILCYPVYICFPSYDFLYPIKTGPNLLSSEQELEFDSLFQVWSSLLDASIHALQVESSLMASFIEGLCELLVQFLDENIMLVQANRYLKLKDKMQNKFVLKIFGEVLGCMEKQSHIMQVENLEPIRSNQETGISIRDKLVKTVAVFVSRILLLSLTVAKADAQVERINIARVFSSTTLVIGCLCLKQDALLFMETLSEPLIHWLSFSASTCDELQQGRILSELELLWTQILGSLQRSEPPVNFESSFLEVQAPLLQVTLDHPYTPISDVTVAFWKATYGKKDNFQYPQCLLPVIYKMSKKGIINVTNTLPLITSCRKSANLRQRRCEVTSVSRLREVEIIEETWKDIEFADVDSMHLELRNKRPKLTEKTVVAEKAHNFRSDARKHFREARKAECIIKMLRREK